VRSDTNSFAVSFDLDSYLRRRKMVIGQNDPFIVHIECLMELQESPKRWQNFVYCKVESTSTTRFQPRCLRGFDDGVQEPFRGLVVWTGVASLAVVFFALKTRFNWCFSVKRSEAHSEAQPVRLRPDALFGCSSCCSTYYW
jgi:hypothetical protein